MISASIDQRNLIYDLLSNLVSSHIQPNHIEYEVTKSLLPGYHLD